MFCYEWGAEVDGDGDTGGMAALRPILGHSGYRYESLKADVPSEKTK